jgi:hypothetical protein
MPEFIFGHGQPRDFVPFQLPPPACTGATAAYQQDQVEVISIHASKGCALAMVADGMGGKSGGRKAADQVLLTGRQIFERYVPAQDDAAEMLRQLVVEAHLMIKLTAITAEEEPHSTVAAFYIGPGLECDVVHAGDSRVYHFRGAEMMRRTVDRVDVAAVQRQELGRLHLVQARHRARKLVRQRALGVQLLGGTSADMISLTRPVVQHVHQPGEAARLAGHAHRHLRHVRQQHGVEARGDLQVVVLRTRAAAQRAEVEPHHAAGRRSARSSRCSMCSTGSSSRASASRSKACICSVGLGPSGQW